jgi:hypothetical protein
MTYRKLLAGSSFVLGLVLATSAAEAHGLGGFACQTASTSKNTAPMTHCTTWTREAAARMKSADCDPAAMSGDAMRQHCAEMSAKADHPATPAG